MLAIHRLVVFETLECDKWISFGECPTFPIRSQFLELFGPLILDLRAEEAEPAKPAEHAIKKAPQKPPWTQAVMPRYFSPCASDFALTGMNTWNAAPLRPS